MATFPPTQGVDLCCPSEDDEISPRAFRLTDSHSILLTNVCRPQPPTTGTTLMRRASLAILLAGLSWGFSTGLCLASDKQPTAEQLRFFETSIRPLLAEHCWKCHGPKKQKADLRLDARARLLRGGESGPAVVPGHPESSLLIKAVRQDDDPAVRAHASWQEADRPPDRGPGTLGPDGPALPAGQDRQRSREYRRQKLLGVQAAGRTRRSPRSRMTAWPRSPLDRFILAGLEAKGLKPGAARRPAHADPPGDLRPDRPAADARGDRRLPRRSCSRRLRPGRGSAAGLAALRRALGPALARRGPLRRLQRPGRERRLRQRLALPRLRHRRLQPRQALRSVRARADRRRPAPAPRDPTPCGTSG